MKWLTLAVTALLADGAAAPSALAFCRFYVARGDAKTAPPGRMPALARGALEAYS